jgi:hypothetical protein
VSAEACFSAPAALGARVGGAVAQLVADPIDRVHVLQGGQGLLDLLVLLQALIDQLAALAQGLADLG